MYSLALIIFVVSEKKAFEYFPPVSLYSLLLIVTVSCVPNVVCVSVLFNIGVVYALFCKHCDKSIYVGETGDTLYQRHLLNLSLIRRQKSDPIAIHFNSTEHSVNDYEIVAFKNICGDDSYRETIEKLWMNKLRTFKPHGLNTKT